MKNKAVIILLAVAIGPWSANQGLDAVKAFRALKQPPPSYGFMSSGLDHTTTIQLTNGATADDLRKILGSEIDFDFQEPAGIIPSPADAPPSSVIVGRYIYTIRFAAHDYFVANKCSGFTVIDQHQIFLDPFYDGISLRQNLWHELMHASIALAGGQNASEASRTKRSNKDDAFISPTASVLVNILRDNPRLVEWLTKKVVL